jgi:flavin-dependent dehydrogenase
MGETDVRRDRFGARCAGSPTAMLLARRGYRVLLVDRATFPSDTISTHYIHIPGVARLKRWGLYERIVSRGCPPIASTTLHLGDAAFQAPRPPLPPDLPEHALSPRRTVLDKLLLDAAVESGVEFRDRFPVQELMFEGDRVTGIRGRGGGSTVEERCQLVIGADGLHSRVARAVQATTYNTHPTLTFGYYTYWSGVRADGAHIYFFPDEMQGVLVFPTNGDKTCVAVGGPIGSFRRFRSDVEGNYLRVLRRVDWLAHQLEGAAYERIVGTADQPNYFRRPYGPGWALVGDAGYHRDFLTGLGITDAFRDAELLVKAVDDAFCGRVPYEEAMADYERRRNEIAEPLYEVTIQMASGEQLDTAAFLRFGAAMMAMIPPALTESGASN